MKRQFVIILILILSFEATPAQRNTQNSGLDAKPRIVNIINFIRLLEPRDAKITQEVLFETVVKQWQLMRKYNLRGTFLLQYDALMDPRYQKFLKNLGDSIEIGAWWEIPQPLVEKAGYKWRGRYPWDWHADVGFATGYTPAEREKLIDVYMEDFRKIFGYYPKSVGSWFIDIHSLNYMYDKYKITASCNCKDQVGTDGYTLWGGYWSQAYYPSRINSYMPAQNEKNQLPVPIFRMLGSDPVRQYDNGLGTSRQGVVSLEPVYKKGGGDETWVNWYFREFVEGECMEYAYVQAGQENSFTWDAMSKGLEIQLPLIASLRDNGKVKVETLAESGQWFRNKYKVTPATSVTINKDVEGSDRKTVWFNSRYYRTNLIWENGNLRIRDIHLFDEKFPSVYTTGVTTTNQASFFTLPFVDGYLWSTSQEIAGLRFKVVINGREEFLSGNSPEIGETSNGEISVKWPLQGFAGNILIRMNERRMTVTAEDTPGDFRWFLELNVAEKSTLPFVNITSNRIDCMFEGTGYSVIAGSGSFLRRGRTFLIEPSRNTIILKMDERD